MIFLAILFACIVTSKARVEITQISDNVPMIFNRLADALVSHDSIKLVYFINMTEYFHLKEIIQQTIDMSENACKQLLYDTCDLQITQLKLQFVNTLRDDEEIRAQRKTRGICNVCGTALYHMVGVMDAKRANRYAHFINKLSEEAKKQHVLMENQTTLFQLFVKTNAKTSQELKGKLLSIESRIKEMNYFANLSVHNIQLALKTQGIIQLASTAITEHFRL